MSTASAAENYRFLCAARRLLRDGLDDPRAIIDMNSTSNRHQRHHRAADF